MGKQALALLAALDTACASVEDLGQAAAESFQQHPDHAIITSFPGLADSTGARVLAELGDDRARFSDARALKAYAGSAPVTRASGRSICITHRRIKNNRLAAAGWIWAFAAVANCPSAREHYRRRREHGDHHQAWVQARPARAELRLAVAVSDDEPVTILGEDESWELLASVALGRLVTCVSSRPEIFPVNFVVQRPTVLFRTAEGTKLLSVVIDKNVAFEADGHSLDEGWSVIVEGTAEVLSTSAQIDEADRAGLRPWVATLKLRYVRIHAATISGRRFRFGPEPDRESTFA